MFLSPATAAVTKYVQGPNTTTCATPPPKPPTKPANTSDKPTVLENLMIPSLANKRIPPIREMSK